MKKAVIFDLYDTVLKGRSFDFSAGVAYVHRTYLSKICTFEQLKAYTDTFLPLYEQRHIDNSEICLLTDELPLWFSRFGVTMPDDADALEYAVMCAMQQCEVLDEVLFVLDELKRRGVPMYILSNTIFTARATKMHLERHGILHYFEQVYASADFGVRKPSSRFFVAAIEDIRARHPEIKKEDMLFVGNDYVSDAGGGVAAGLDTVWYNVSGAANEHQLPIKITDDFRDILRLI